MRCISSRVITSPPSLHLDFAHISHSAFIIPLHSRCANSSNNTNNLIKKNKTFLRLTGDVNAKLLRYCRRFSLGGGHVLCVNDPLINSASRASGDLARSTSGKVFNVQPLHPNAFRQTPPPRIVTVSFKTS